MFEINLTKLDILWCTMEMIFFCLKYDSRLSKLISNEKIIFELNKNNSHIKGKFGKIDFLIENPIFNNGTEYDENDPFIQFVIINHNYICM